MLPTATCVWQTLHSTFSGFNRYRSLSAAGNVGTTSVHTEPLKSRWAVAILRSEILQSCHSIFLFGIIHEATKWSRVLRTWPVRLSMCGTYVWSARLFNSLRPRVSYQSNKVSDWPFFNDKSTLKSPTRTFRRRWCQVFLDCFQELIKRRCRRAVANMHSCRSSIITPFNVSCLSLRCCLKPCTCQFIDFRVYIDSPPVNALCECT